jgi:DNA replication protein DnaC
MDSDFIRTKVLNNIPTQKLKEILSEVDNSSDDMSTKNIKRLAYNRYYESNIPIEYWFIKMEKDFVGDSNALKLYQDYIFDIKKSYLSGKSFILGGSQGVGKTTVLTSILKKTCVKGFSSLYTSLSDIVNVTISAPTEERFFAKRELTMVDFLVIDEFDPRFMGSEQSSELFGRTLETIFRTRSQNKLPTLMSTNSPNVIQSFTGPIKVSLDSLMSGYLNIIPIFGNDFRKQNGA